MYWLNEIKESEFQEFYNSWRKHNTNNIQNLNEAEETAEDLFPNEEDFISQGDKFVVWRKASGYVPKKIGTTSTINAAKDLMDRAEERYKALFRDNAEFWIEDLTTGSVSTYYGA